MCKENAGGCGKKEVGRKILREKKRHDLYVVPFLFGMSLRGFPRCIAVLFLYTKLGNAL